MRSPGRATSGAGRGWSAERASFLDRLDLEVRSLPARRVLQRRLGGQAWLGPVVAHDVALLERMRGCRHRRGISPLQGVDRSQDVPELIAVADDLVWCNPQARQARDVLDFAGRKLGLGFGQDV